MHQHLSNERENIMIKNIGSTDRIARILFAVVVAALFAFNVISGTVAIVLGLLAVVLFATALVGTCPIYLAAKMSTKKTEKVA
jgi:hypothetical protein